MRHIVIEFYRTHTPFVVIEQNSDVLDDLLHIGDILYIQDDATQDETLIEAGIERAKGVVAAIGDDKDNVFIVLSARSLNPQLHSRDGNHIFNPKGATILKQGDTLVVLGTEAQILKLYDSLEQSLPHTSFAEVIRQIEEDHC